MSKGKKLSAKERKVKLENDKKERRKIFSELCEHVRAGYSLDCFAPLSDTSIREFFKRYPEEFEEEEFIESLRKGKTFWEGIGIRQSTGECLGNSRSWYYNMSNRYGWNEKAQIETEHKGQVSVNIISYASKKSSDNSESNQ